MTATDTLSTESTLFHRAQAGALLLDSIEAGWYHHTDPDKLQMDVGWIGDGKLGCGCVLALLDGRSFNKGASDRHIDGEARVSLGFTLDNRDFDFISQWEILTKAWQQEILVRLGTE